MREQIEHLEKSIMEYTNYWDSNYDIRTMFSFIQEFFEN